MIEGIDIKENRIKYIKLICIIMGNYDEDCQEYNPEEDLEIMFPDTDARAEYDEEGNGDPNDW